MNNNEFEQWSEAVAEQGETPNAVPVWSIELDEWTRDWEDTYKSLT